MYDFTKLRAWQSAKEYFVLVYDVTKTFPNEERYGFTSQMRGAARSICANLAEGTGYTGGKDSGRFYQMGFGSSSESYSDLYLTQAVGLISDAEFDRLEKALVPTRKQVSEPIRSIDRR
jgi:four helix bundle protein